MAKENIATSKAIRKIRVLHDLKCQMRDGTELATDVYMPLDGGPFPTLLFRTPYDKYDPDGIIPDSVTWAQKGYAVVNQDVRGRYDSAGDWYPFMNEASDGHDAIEWTSKQEWSNGKVGTIGRSYTGLTQWQAAQGGSPNLIASFPGVSYSNAYHHWVYTGGAFQLAFGLKWCMVTSTRTMKWQYLWLPEEITLNSLYWHLPLNTMDEQGGRTIRHWKDWISHPSYDEYWRKAKPVDEHYHQIDNAAYSVAGWYDVFLPGALNNFMGVTKEGKTEKTRRSQKLIVGPWIHNRGGSGTLTKTGDIDFGGDVLFDLKTEETRWFDYWLKGINNGIMDEPRVNVFVMGSNLWRKADDWPIPGTAYTPYYLHSNGNANSLHGDGLLSTSSPGVEPPDSYVYDPKHPVMTIGGNVCCAEGTVPVSMGPQDQRPVEYRSDVLVYTTPPLEEDIEVTGPVKALIYASSTALDTDFTAKLVDVFPNGYAMNLCHGIIRARYRNSWEKPSLLEPGNTYGYTIDLWATGNCFRKGHQIRLEISSSNFPNFDRNPNTGNPFGQDVEMEIAQQTIHHDSERPSHIILPVIPK